MKRLVALIGGVGLVTSAAVMAAPRTQAEFDAQFPRLPWTDFYGTEHSPDIPDQVRSFMIAKQVCHYFQAIYPNRISEAEGRYIEANIAANCPGLDQRERQLRAEFADDPVAISAIDRQIAALERPTP